MERLTKEILQERSNKIHNFKYEIVGEYINNLTKIKILHKECGNIFEQRPSNHLQGKGCIGCSGRELGSVEKLQQKSDEKHNNGYLIIGDYINNESKIKIKHLICNTEFEATPSSHLKSKGCCSKCFTSVSSNKKELQKRSNTIHNNEYKILGDYINCDTKILIKHKKCGNIFSQTPDKHLHNNRCPKCFGKNKLSKEILQERSNKKYDNEYTILGEYVNSQTPILIKHNCGSEYLQTPNNHLRERICYKCRGLQSIGEKLIQNYLLSKNIKFNYNKSLLDCNYFNRKLRFDFYLPDYNMCIEYDGEQHFKSISKFGGDENFIITKKRDDIKSEWCLENNIPLLRISYKEQVIDKLDTIFNI